MLWSTCHTTLPLTTMTAGLRLLQPWGRLGSWKLSVLCLIVFSLCCQAAKLGQRDLTPLSSKAITSLIASPDPVRNVDPRNPNSHLSKILIPRAPDTANNTQVRRYIVDTLKKLKWHVEEDSFNDTTPYGVKRFANVIATKDPKAARRVIVAAHFDSKFFESYPSNQACRFRLFPFRALTRFGSSS